MNTSCVDGYKTFELVWRERVVTVCYQANWLNCEYWHIELRCVDRLPVTETGCRSQFIPAADLADESAIHEWIVGWLDCAAEQPAWQQYVVDSRQLRLF